MFDVNVFGVLDAVQALLPAARRDWRRLDGVIELPAGLISYRGRGGYVVAKHGTHAIAETLRLELFDQPVRIIEIATGMVKNDEFAVNRYRGDAGKAAAVYAGEGAAHRRRRGRRSGLVRHPASALQRGPDGNQAAGAGSAVQGFQGAVTASE